jgi:hypothetical protein
LLIFGNFRIDEGTDKIGFRYRLLVSSPLTILQPGRDLIRSVAPNRAAVSVTGNAILRFANLGRHYSLVRYRLCNVAHAANSILATRTRARKGILTTADNRYQPDHRHRLYALRGSPCRGTGPFKQAHRFSYHLRWLESMQVTSGRPSPFKSAMAHAAAPMPPLSRSERVQRLAAAS